MVGRSDLLERLPRSMDFRGLGELQRFDDARVRSSRQVSRGTGNVPPGSAREKQGGHALADAGPVTFGTRLTCSHFPSGYEAISYGRGAWLFHMLRYMMRDAVRKGSGHSGGIPDAQADAPFLRALNKIRERFQEKSTTTREVL